MSSTRTSANCACSTSGGDFGESSDSAEIRWIPRKFDLDAMSDALKTVKEAHETYKDSLKLPSQSSRSDQDRKLARESFYREEDATAMTQTFDYIERKLKERISQYAKDLHVVTRREDKEDDCWDDFLHDPKSQAYFNLCQSIEATRNDDDMQAALMTGFFSAYNSGGPVTQKDGRGDAECHIERWKSDTDANLKRYRAHHELYERNYPTQERRKYNAILTASNCLSASSGERGMQAVRDWEIEQQTNKGTSGATV